MDMAPILHVMQYVCHLCPGMGIARGGGKKRAYAKTRSSLLPTFLIGLKFDESPPYILGKIEYGSPNVNHSLLTIFRGHLSTYYI